MLPSMGGSRRSSRRTTGCTGSQKDVDGAEPSGAPGRRRSVEGRSYDRVPRCIVDRRMRALGLRGATAATKSSLRTLFLRAMITDQSVNAARRHSGRCCGKAAAQL